MKDIILASSSSRRVQLLEQAGLSFSSVPSFASEDFDTHDTPDTTARKLSVRKAKKVFEDIPGERNVIVIGADTIVVLHGEVLNKPQSFREAYDMLKSLSGNTHQVITGVCIISEGTELSFTDTTEVTFSSLSDEQIRHYINTSHPYDKAGGYAIQEWIGLVGIKEIKGNYYNVMGLPVNKLIRKLSGLGIEIRMKS